jgi:hypothetical protein
LARDRLAAKLEKMPRLGHRRVIGASGNYASALTSKGGLQRAPEPGSIASRKSFGPVVFPAPRFFRCAPRAHLRMSEKEECAVGRIDNEPAPPFRIGLVDDHFSRGMETDLFWSWLLEVPIETTFEE